MEEEAIRLCRHEQESGKKVVFTHGAFDVLHSGHISFLERAADAGDVLVVGVHLDEHVRAYKGVGRPLLPAQDRVRVIGALRVVDHAVFCPDSDAVGLIEALRPDIYVKDDGIDVLTTAEAQSVTRYGGEVIILPYTSGVSTSRIIQRFVREIGFA